MKRLTVLLLLLPACAWAQLSATLPVAKGVYRVPYLDGTQVQITADHTNHGNNNPMSGTLGVRNRMDMIGLPAGDTHTIVAAGDGRIRLIEDDNTLWCPDSPTNDFTICNGIANCCEQDDPSCNSNCANNFVWIEHANGEWTKYSHPQTGTVRGNGWSEGDFIQSGEELGLEGQVGFASGPHLHFEVAEPRQQTGSYDPNDINDPNHPIGADGFLKGDGENTNPSYERENRVLFFCQAGLLLDNDVAEAGPCDGLCGTDNQNIGGTVTDNNVDYLQVTNDLTIDGLTVSAGGGMAVRGGNSVTLLPGFHAEGDSYFSASIGACDSPGT